jgi:hypothetical protein
MVHLKDQRIAACSIIDPVFQMTPYEKAGVAIRTVVDVEMVISGESHVESGYIVINKPDVLVEVKKAIENWWERVSEITSTTRNTACSIRHLKKCRYHIGSAFRNSLIQARLCHCEQKDIC